MTKAVDSYCPTQAELNAMTRQFKLALIHNNELAGKKC